MEPEQRRGSEYYRQRAAEMRQRAKDATEADLRDSYLQLAANWDYLAELAEKSQH